MTAPSARGAMTGTLCPWCHDSLFALAQVDDATRTLIMDVHLTRYHYMRTWSAHPRDPGLHTKRTFAQPSHSPITSQTHPHPPQPSHSHPLATRATQAGA
jgi:hypothetical protein